jgi:hypothetical protein
MAVRGDRGRSARRQTNDIDTTTPVGDESLVESTGALDPSLIYSEVGISARTVEKQIDVIERYNAVDLDRRQYLQKFTGVGQVEWQLDSQGRLNPVPTQQLVIEGEGATDATEVVQGPREAPRGGSSTSAPTVPKRITKREDTLLSNIEDNILDHYDAVTYHFRLFLTGENSNKTGGGRIPYEDLDQVTLAETGTSTVGIDNVQIKTYGGMTKETGSGVATTITFELKQPFGVTFLDMILAAAKKLGIKDYTKAPFNLELTFRARDPETQLPIKGGPLENLRWVWPMIITKTNIKVGIGGSEYSIEAVNQGDLGYTNQVADLKQVEAIPATTVGEFFEELKNRLEKQGSDFSVPTKKDEYYFYIDEDIAKERIIVDNQEAAAQRSGPFEISEDRKTITFNQNTSIDRVVDSIMSMTSYFQVKGTGLKNPDTSNDPVEDKEQIIVTELWKVISDVEFLDYNTERGDYNRRYKYLIIPYAMPTAKTATKTKENIPTPEVVQIIKNRGVLRKLYNYVYTGENDQVLDFDVNFNFNWYAALPYNAGIFGSGDVTGLPAQSAGNDPGANLESQSEEIKLESLDNLLSAESLFADFRDRVRNELSGTVSDDWLFSSTGDTIANAPIPTSDLIGNSREGRIFNPDTGRYEIPEGFRTEAITSRAFRVDVDDLVLEAEDKNIPVTFREHGQGRTENIAASGEHNRGKTFLSAVFEQATTPAAADLLSIEIKVKGDPYWLEPSPVGKRQRPKNNIDVELQKRGLKVDSDGKLIDVSSDEDDVPMPENFSVGTTMTEQTFFGFRMFTPQEYDPETGIMKQNSEGNLLNGLYGVIEVTHEFSEGKFTQSMKAVRQLDARMNASLFEKLANGEDLTLTAEGQ